MTSAEGKLTTLACHLIKQ